MPPNVDYSAGRGTFPPRPQQSSEVDRHLRVDAPADGVIPGPARLSSDRDTLSPMDTHAAVRMLTAAGADEALAVAVVDVAQNAAADHGRELATRSDPTICVKYSARIWPPSKLA